jgi:MFS family permease
MSGFTIVWIGQLISLLGTSMTNFALTIWAFEQSGRATDLALIGFFFLAPLLFFSPIAGAIVDRSNRKLMMMLSDLASGIVTILLLLLYQSDLLQIWHLYIGAAVMGTFQTFQWPAYSATISTMLPKTQFARANAMIGLAESGSGILAPVLAGAILALAGMGAIFAIDVFSFVFAISALLLVNIPQPEKTKTGMESKGSLLSESVFGFRYIWRRPSLLGLQLLFFSANFFNNLGFTLLAPMVLSRTNSNELIFGSVQSTAAVGGVVGGLVMTAWGGPKRLVYGVLVGWGLVGTFQALFGLGQATPVWMIAGFIMAFMTPIINGSNQAIWQAKVEPDVQGRVFSIRRLIAWVSSPLAMLIAGPLADNVLEPAMQSDGALAQTFGGLVGNTAGSGMSLVMFFTGLAIVLVAVIAYFVPVVRHAEELLPDHLQVTEEAEPASEISETSEPAPI